MYLTAYANTTGKNNNNLPENKSPEPYGLTGDFYKTYKKSLYLSFSNYSKRLKRREYSQSHSMKPPSPWYQNQTKILPKIRKLQDNIFNEYRCSVTIFEDRICKEVIRVKWSRRAGPDPIGLMSFKRRHKTLTVSLFAMWRQHQNSCLQARMRVSPETKAISIFSSSSQLPELWDSVCCLSNLQYFSAAAQAEYYSRKIIAHLYLVCEDILIILQQFNPAYENLMFVFKTRNQDSCCYFLG